MKMKNPQSHLNASSNGRTSLVKDTCAKLLEGFTDPSRINAMVKLLSKYQPNQVTMYEIDRCRYTLEHIDNLECYFTCEVGKLVCVFLPSNLPLYSVLLFAITPALLGASVIMRPNTTLIQQGVVEEMMKILQLPLLLPKITIFCGDRVTFGQLHLSQADLIVFTGRNETRDEIKKCMKPGSYLINNGSGHNPIVVAADADVETSTNDVLYARFFNSGQDCAGPDAVFVHDKLIDDFLNRLKEKVAQLRVMESDEEMEEKDSQQPVLQHDTNKGSPIQVTKLHRVEELCRLQDIVDKFKDNVVCGGKVDMTKKLVYPTIILGDSPNDGNVNLTEIFGPILFLYVYQNDDELHEYFQNSRYIQNKMYVSLYGTCEYIQERNDEELIKRKGSAKGGVGILLKDKIIHDISVDNGTQPYGGYSKGASSIYHIKENNLGIASVALPILIPKVMFQLFVEQIAIHKLVRPLKHHHALMSPAARTAKVVKEKRPKHKKHKFAEEFIAIVESAFSPVLFAFAFGSVTEDSYEDVLCSYVCVKDNPKLSQQRNRFSQQIENFHKAHGFDRQYITRIITNQELRHISSTLALNCSFLTDNEFKCHDGVTYDGAFLLSVLAEKPKFALKCTEWGFLHEVIFEAKQVTQLIRFEILENLRRTFKQTGAIPQVLRSRYPEMTDAAIVQKLEGLNCCEILRHVEWMPPEKQSNKTLIFD